MTDVQAPSQVRIRLTVEAHLPDVFLDPDCDLECMIDGLREEYLTPLGFALELLEEPSTRVHLHLVDPDADETIEWAWRP